MMVVSSSSWTIDCSPSLLVSACSVMSSHVELFQCIEYWKSITVSVLRF